MNFPSRLIKTLAVLTFLTSIFTIPTANGTKKSEDKQKEIDIAVTDEEKKLLAKLNEDPGDLTNILNLAEYHFQQAAEYDMQYLWGTPKHSRDNQQKAIFYSMKAIDYFKKALVKDPNNATLYARLAESYGIRMRNGGLGAKLKYMKYFKSNLRKSLKIDPSNFEALITKAYKTMYTPVLFKNRNKSAKKQFEKLLKKYPDHPDVNKGLAIAHERLGNRDEALKCVNRTLELKPNDLEAIALKEKIKKKLEKKKKKGLKK